MDQMTVCLLFFTAHNFWDLVLSSTSFPATGSDRFQRESSDESASHYPLSTIEQMDKVSDELVNKVEHLAFFSGFHSCFW